jgi:hypothetical protein
MQSYSSPLVPNNNKQITNNLKPASNFQPKFVCSVEFSTKNRLCSYLSEVLQNRFEFGAVLRRNHQHIQWLVWNQAVA